MRKLVPLNSLVITVGPTPAVNAACVNQYFETYEVISAEDVREELVGDRTRKDIDGVVFSEVHRRVLTKLKLGERVVVCAPNLRRDSRVALAEIGVNHGVPVFYLVCDDEEAEASARTKFISTEKDVLRGDSLAEVIDRRVCDVDVVRKLNAPADETVIEKLSRRYNGITVVGDMHGMYHSLLATLEWARERKHFVLSLGDIIDYGPGTLETADEVYRLVMRGGGEMIIGNHERKIARWIDQNDRGRSMMKLSDGNKVTTQALNRAGASVRDRWSSRFRGFVSRSPLSVEIGDFFFAHAAAHPSVWSGEDFDPRAAENFCLFGEYDPTAEGERPARTYNWVEAIPAGKTVIVGHDARSTMRPVVETNAQGGKAIFLDTGSGKGGNLSSVDLRFNEAGRLELQNFNMH